MHQFTFLNHTLRSGRQTLAVQGADLEATLARILIHALLFLSCGTSGLFFNFLEPRVPQY